MITLFRILLLLHFCFLISFPIEVNITDNGPQYDSRRGLLGCEYKLQLLEMYPAYVNNTGVVINGLIEIFRALLNETNVSIDTYLMVISAQHVSVVAGADCGWPS